MIIIFKFPLVSFILMAICHLLGLKEIAVGILLLYIKETVPAREVSVEYSTAKEVETKAIEINLNSVKWLLIGIYRPPSLSRDFFLEEMRRNFEIFCT